jgi:hypothetical protein
MDKKVIDALSSVTGAAKIEIASPTGRVIDLPFSLRGFADARKAMTDLAREKTAASAAAPPTK